MTAAPDESAAPPPEPPPESRDPRDHGGTLWGIAFRRLFASKSALVGLGICAFMLALALLGPFVAPESYRAQDTRPEAMRAAPSLQEPFGRDDLGRDVFSRILHGGRFTLGVGLATVAIGLLVGVPLGLVSGYFRGRVDSIIMRIVDVFLAFPDYLLALAIIAVLGRGLLNAMLAVGLAFIPKFARIVRASALAESGLDYVAGARAIGGKHVRLIFRHVLPNCLAPMLVVATLSLGTAILFTSALSFLGLGAKPPYPEWGAMLAEGREASFQAPHLMIFPGLAIALAVLGVNLLGDGLRDALDVRLEEN